YDASGAIPQKVTFTSVELEDTDPSEFQVTGTVRWVVPSGEDLAYMSQYSVYLADAEDGSNPLKVASVPRGTNSLAIASPLATEGRSFVLVYGENPVGMSVSPSIAASFFDEGLPTSTSTTSTFDGTTTQTMTTTNPYLISAKNLRFSDAAPEGGMIGGFVIWDPPYIAPSEN
ncbi:unnamed protein product, partial [Polarella glacialis]